MEIPLEIHVERPGEYEIACAELCGLGHSQMRSLLIVMAPEEYDSWKREKSEESLRTPR
jgi:cytochrome c oxidase subunit 2